MGAVKQGEGRIGLYGTFPEFLSTTSIFYKLVIGKTGDDSSTHIPRGNVQEETLKWSP